MEWLVLAAPAGQVRGHKTERSEPGVPPRRSSTPTWPPPATTLSMRIHRLPSPTISGKVGSAQSLHSHTGALLRT